MKKQSKCIGKLLSNFKVEVVNILGNPLLTPVMFWLGGRRWKTKRWVMLIDMFYWFYTVTNKMNNMISNLHSDILIYETRNTCTIYLQDHRHKTTWIDKTLHTCTYILQWEHKCNVLLTFIYVDIFLEGYLNGIYVTFRIKCTSLNDRRFFISYENSYDIAML